MAEPSDEDIDLAQALLLEWDEGRGTSKSQIEIREWGDATSHGRRFDRFILKTLGVQTSKRSRQSQRLEDLERQIWQLGEVPIGAEPQTWQLQLQHARRAALAGLRVWNDPTAGFRAGAFSLLFVAAWNSLLIALLMRDGEEWRDLKDDGTPALRDGEPKSLDTLILLEKALPQDRFRGLRANVRFWQELRNCVAHRHLPALDPTVIPYAQAGLLNFEETIAREFGSEYALADQLSVPLQLSGFRDPGILRSLKQLQSALPLDVQDFLNSIVEDEPTLLSDPTFVLRVAFIPAVPPSGRSPDAVAYFVKPGEIPEELADALDKYVVLPKIVRSPRPNLGAKAVVEAVSKQIPFRFTTKIHAELTYSEGCRPRPGAGDPNATDTRFCEYVPAAKLHLYTQAWVDHLVEMLSTEDGYRAATGRPPVVPEDYT